MKDEMIPVLRKAVEWAETEAVKPREARQWLQEVTYAPEERRVFELGHKPGCGTAYCIAGWITAVHTGCEDPYDGTAEAAGWDHSKSWGVMLYAQELLGLTTAEADRLFAADNTIEDVRSIAEGIAGQEL